MVQSSSGLTPVKGVMLIQGVVVVGVDYNRVLTIEELDACVSQNS